MRNLNKNKKIVLIGVVLIFFVIGGIIYFKFSSQTLPSFFEISQKNSMKISSPAFSNGDVIPKKYTCDGENISPPLKIENPPSKTKTFVLIVEDPDAPFGVFTHWIVWNIPSTTEFLAEGSVPKEAVEGVNDFGKRGYGGPCPPPHSLHRYFFKLYALDDKIELPFNIKKELLERAIKQHIISKAEFFGVYKR